MFGLFVIVFLLSIPVLLLGLIRPSLYSRLLKSNTTRKKIALIFGGIMLVSFIGIAATVPPTDDVQGIAEKSDTNVRSDAQGAANEEETVDSNSVDAVKDANPVQEDDQTAEPSSVANESDEDVQEDSGSSSEDSVGANEPAQAEDTSISTEASSEPAVESAEESIEPATEEAEPEEPETPTAETSEETTTASCYCSSNTYNCSYEDFSSKAEAQALYECCLMEVGYDVHDLDRNSDGQACESLQ